MTPRPRKRKFRLWTDEEDVELLLQKRNHQEFNIPGRDVVSCRNRIAYLKRKKPKRERVIRTYANPLVGFLMEEIYRQGLNISDVERLAGLCFRTAWVQRGATPNVNSLDVVGQTLGYKLAWVDKDGEVVEL